MPRLVYIGNFDPPRSTENAYRHAFEMNGCKVSMIQQERADRLAVQEFARDADLVLYTRTHNHTALGPEWTGTWRTLETAGVRTASVHLDVFVGVERYGMDWNDPLFTTGMVFTPDPLLGSRINTERTIHKWLPPAADIRHGDPDGEPIQGLDGKIVFVGSKYGTSNLHPEYPWRAELLDWLNHTYGTDFFWYGGGTPFGALRGKGLWDIYTSDCVIVGDSCFAGERPWYWSDRVPETLGHGGLLVHPLIDGILETHPALITYEPQNFKGLSETIELVRRWQPETKRAAHVLHRERIRANHTYVHRARTILTALGL